MKKLAITCLFGSLLLTGCSGKNNQAEPTKIQDSNYQVTDTNIGFVKNTAKLSNLEIKLLEFQKVTAPKDSIFDTPYLKIWFDVTNKSDQDIPLSDAWISGLDVFQTNSLPKVAVNEKGKELKDTYKGIGEDKQPIKPGATIHGEATYALEDDKNNTVKIQLTNGFNGEKVATAELKLQ